jgi:hypothetical protein
MPTKQKKPLEKPDPTKEMTEKIIKMLEIPVEPPSIEEEIKAAQKAIAAAKQMKQKKLIKHNCTECGNSGVQLYHAAGRSRNAFDHFKCYITEDNEFCDEHGEPFTDPDKLEALRQVREKGHVS